MKTILNIPFNQFDERLTTLHEFMLLSSVSTIIMCSHEVSLLWKADVHLADTANCHSPPVCVCLSVSVCVCVCVSKGTCICVWIYSKHTAGKNPKESQKWFNLTPGHLSLPEEMIEGAVINYFSACDLQGRILPFPQAYVTPVFLFSIYCLPLFACFILFQMYQLHSLVLLWLGLRVVSCGCLSDVSPRPP